MTFPWYENWDSDVPPALTAGWTAASQITTTASGATPISSPNTLAFDTADASTFYTATHGPADGNGGNVVVSGTALFAATSTGTSGSSVSVFARGNSSNLGYTFSSFYEARLTQRTSGHGGPFLYLSAFVGGARTTLGSNSIASLANTNWYRITLSLAVTSLSVSVQDLVSLNWLNSAGNWQAGQTTALTAADGTVSGAGYAGYAFQTSSTPAALYADDWSFGALPIPNGFPTVARIGIETEQEPGRAAVSGNRVVPPVPQLGRARTQTGPSVELPADPGNYIAGGSRTPSIAPFPRPARSLHAVGIDLALDPGRVIARSAKPITIVVQRTAISRTTNQEQSTEAGKTYQGAAIVGSIRTDFVKPQRIGMREELSTDPGSWLKSSVHSHVNLWTPPIHVVLPETLAPHPGSAIFHAAAPQAITQTSTAAKSTIVQAETPVDSGSAKGFVRLGPTQPFGKPPSPLVVRASDPDADPGQFVSKRAPRAYDVLSTRSMITQQETPTDAGRVTSLHGPGSHQDFIPRAVIARQEQVLESGRVVIDTNPTSIVFTQSRTTVARPAELATEGGKLATAIGKPISAALFSRPARAFIATVEQPAPEGGMIHTFLASQPSTSEYVSDVDPDLATLITITTSSGGNNEDPDAASLVI